MALNPWYVTGLVDGEGCFSVSFSQRAKLKLKIETRPSFSISLNARDLALLKEIANFFECGGLRFSKSDQTYKYETRAINDLIKVIIPHFKRYPLVGQKVRDFQLFEKICQKVNANLHRNNKELCKIIELAYTMNPSGKRRYNKLDLLKIIGESKV